MLRFKSSTLASNGHHLVMMHAQPPRHYQAPTPLRLHLRRLGNLGIGALGMLGGLLLGIIVQDVLVIIFVRDGIAGCSLVPPPYPVLHGSGIRGCNSVR